MGTRVTRFQEIIVTGSDWFYPIKSKSLQTKKARPGLPGRAFLFSLRLACSVVSAAPKGESAARIIDFSLNDASTPRAAAIDVGSCGADWQARLPFRGRQDRPDPAFYVFPNRFQPILRHNCQESRMCDGVSHWLVFASVPCQAGFFHGISFVNEIS